MTTISTWLPALPATLVAIATLLIPGAIVVWAGFRWDPRALLAAPAVSIGILSLAATGAGAVGVAWGLLPVVGLTVVAALVAWGARVALRSPVTYVPPASQRATLLAAGAGLVLGGAILVRRLLAAFVSPTGVSFSFDNTFHFNAVVYAVETHNASAFHIGDLTDVAFYPNGWNALASFTALLSGADAATAINGAGIALAAVVWPLSCLALGWHFFKGRPLAMFLTGALSAAFGAFPYKFFDWGALYPNVLGLAVLPATLALVLMTFEKRDWRARALLGVLALAAAAGGALAHPNSFVSLAYFVAAMATVELALIARRAASTRARVAAFGGIIGAWGALLMLLLATRTNFDWPEWQTPEQAVGEGLLVAPASMPVALGTSVLLVVAYVTYARHPRELRSAVPFLVSLALFVLNSGFPIGTPFRNLLGDPFYNDNVRFAALLGVTVIPVAVVGAQRIYDVARAWLSRATTRRASRPFIVRGAAVVGAGALVLICTGPGVDQVVTRIADRFTPDVPGEPFTYVTQPEYDLLVRLDETTPQDALIMGIPAQGASWAFGLGLRDVVEPHIHGQLTADEEYLAHHFNEIETNPEVCAAATRVGVTHVLDLGTVFFTDNTGNDKTYDGLLGLEPGSHLRVVDQTASDARLLEVVGCA